jgi:gluconate 2-dehydrogenase gamma chain
MPEATPPQDPEKQSFTRRNLLARATVLVASAELGASAFAGCGNSADQSATALAGDTDDSEAGYEPPRSRPPGPGIYSFFTAHQAATVDAIMGRLIPGTPDDPGAREAGVTTYIDLKLAQFGSFAVPTYVQPPYAKLVNHPVGPQENATGTIAVYKTEFPRYGFQSSLTPQDTYQKGLDLLDRYTHRVHRAPFVELDHGAQDELLTKMEAGEIDFFQSPTSQGFFGMLLEDAYEGMFADPQYGGNRDFAGWKLIGYPGAQRAYTPYELLHGPQHKRVQGLKQMMAMNPGRPADDAIMPIAGSRMAGMGGGG